MGVLGFDSRRGLGIFLFTTASRMALGPTQPAIQWVLGALSLEVKRPAREADHPPPPSGEVKECVEVYLHSTQYAFMAWCSAKRSIAKALPLPYLLYNEELQGSYESLSVVRILEFRNLRWSGNVDGWRAKKCKRILVGTLW
jgi:hypothetical protein